MTTALGMVQGCCRINATETVGFTGGDRLHVPCKKREWMCYQGVTDLRGECKTWRGGKSRKGKF